MLWELDLTNLCNKVGNKVVSVINANNIARQVNNPNNILGTKSEKLNSEKPKAIMIVVYKRA